jgi:hypothetical protein
MSARCSSPTGSHRADRFKDDVLAYAFKLADQPVLARP